MQIPPEYIPPPSGLAYTLTGGGLIKLQWNTTNLKQSNLIGYFIEYKITKEKSTSLTTEGDTEGMTEGEFERNFNVLSAEEKYSWLKFAMVPRNLSEYVIPMNHGVFRSSLYHFRICSVLNGDNSYTQPSDSIFVNTTGLYLRA